MRLSSRRFDATASLRILQSFPIPTRATNPYITQLLASFPDDADVRTFSWREALTGDYSVLHLHWPELMLRANDRPHTVIRLVLGLAVYLRCRARRTSVVRTMHNHSPHEPRSRFEGWLLRAFDRLTTVRIALNPSDVQGASVLIPHGHYRDWFADIEVPHRRTGHLAFFGLVRGYKNVEHLVDTFIKTNIAHLVVAGRVVDEGLRAGIVEASSRSDRVELRLEYIEDPALAAVIGQSELIVLPYSDMNNSGAALLALSLDRPVLVPSTPSNESLAREVGEDWVIRFAGELTPAALAAAVDLARRVGPVGPDLSAREWKAAAVAHLDVYRRAVEERRRV